MQTAVERKLLIVEDELEMRRELAFYFRHKGFTVKEAKNGREGLATFQEFHPDAVVLDIRMPNGSGRDFLADLRQRKVDDAVILCISGYADLSVGDALSEGADVYFPKPFNPDDLLKAAESFLSRKAQLKQERDSGTTIKERLSATSEIFELGLMSAHVAHEINNRLAVITTAIDLIGDASKPRAAGDTSKKLEEPVPKLVARVKKQIEGIAKTIHGLEALSYRGGPGTFVAAYFHKIVEDITALCDKRFKVHDVTFHLDMPAETVLLTCYPHQISQILVNILNNAADAVAEAPERWVRLAAKPVGAFLEVRISDSGPGIPADVAERIFEPFFTTKPFGSGTGLGLSLAKRMVTLHGGELELETRNGPTCFCVRLPISK